MLHNSEIKRAKKTKSLGVIVDEGLNWEQHFKVVKGKLVPQKQLYNVYRALTESHLRYANAIWGSIPGSKIKILQNIQDRARTIIERARIKNDSSHQVSHKKRPTFERLLFPECIGNDILQYFIE